jgi:hypothetical protein
VMLMVVLGSTVAHAGIVAPRQGLGFRV